MQVSSKVGDWFAGLLRAEKLDSNLLNERTRDNRGKQKVAEQIHAVSKLDAQLNGLADTFDFTGIEPSLSRVVHPRF